MHRARRPGCRLVGPICSARSSLVASGRPNSKFKRRVYAPIRNEPADVDSSRGMPPMPVSHGAASKGGKRPAHAKMQVFALLRRLVLLRLSRCCYPAVGSVNRNRLPLPTSLSAQMRPPCCSTMLRHSANPSPVPPSARESEASPCSNRSKMRSSFSGSQCHAPGLRP
jgi:hypothetical protein